jgi:hypothetical protein
MRSNNDISNAMIDRERGQLPWDLLHRVIVLSSRVICAVHFPKYFSLSSPKLHATSSSFLRAQRHRQGREI